jgi:hypothetical protein
VIRGPHGSVLPRCSQRCPIKPQVESRVSSHAPVRQTRQGARLAIARKIIVIANTMTKENRPGATEAIDDEYNFRTDFIVLTEFIFAPCSRDKPEILPSRYG